MHKFHGWTGLALLSALVVALYWALVPIGFFYLDDFAFAEVAKSHGFWASLIHPHIEHFLPLYRAQYWVLCHLTNAAPWAFNIVSLLSLAFAIHALLRVLEEFGVDGAWRVCFLVVALLWPRWGDWFQGYYCLTFYVQNVGFFAWGFLACLRARSEPGRLGGAFVCSLLAVANDISGVWVPAALVLVLFANRWRAVPDSNESVGSAKPVLTRWMIALALLPLAGIVIDTFVVPHRTAAAMVGSDQLIYGHGVPALFRWETLSYIASLPLDIWGSLITPAWLPSGLPWKLWSRDRCF